MFSKFTQTRKAMKLGPELTAALAPDDAVVVDAPADYALSAIESAIGGDHQPAAELLRWTRENRDWDERSHLVGLLGPASLRAPQWLSAWESVAPEDPDLAVVKGRVLVEQAWQQRSNSRASDVSREQFDAFHATLADATEQLQRAVDLSPGDPEPWALALTHARGLEANREVFDEYLEQLWDTDRHHHEGNAMAMQYLAEKWFGSHDEMWGFAHRAVDGAPAGASIQTLPLAAVLEHLAQAPGAALTEDPARVEDAIARARGYLDAHPDAGHHVTAPTRNVLARILFHLKRFDEAYDELLAIGPHATDFPWGYWGDARQEFLDYRRFIVTKKAATS